MKNILCYGDSNTFGYNSKDNSRYDENTRWTALLQKNLGTEYNVINEGMPNRTGFVDNPDGVLFSSQKHFPETLQKTDSVDCLILAVGTNDLMFKYNITFDTIEKGLNNLIKIAKEKTDNIIIIPPTIMNENILTNGLFGTMFDKKSIEKSKKAGKIFKQIADKNNCRYFDINEFAAPSDFDGLHYDKNSHKLIADKLAEFLK
ncbi:MAG: hypothetical protein K6C94_02365 [Candidatus Gastranaerophilales bacterium]|nr:hypothetical protein [Candidatus Gastranaerophilales bacterium]